ncbi:MAG TPA: DNA mismatch repair protein MutS [Thermoplasmata archaeon]|nr:DNA mismatch repair protein MutS [Thermoplasmata archaeon]
MATGGATTPLLEQYEGVKARYPGHLVLFRVGDFFETFGDDARLLAREVDVVLTARGADARGERTPMAGVPYHAVDTYLGRLVQKGYKVALCDQVEDARFAKGLVRREVTRVVTPGTVLDDRILGGPDHSFLASVVFRRGGVGGYAVVDLSTGDWLSGGADGPGDDGLLSAVAPFLPREVIWSGDAEHGPPADVVRREFPRARLEAAPAPVARAELPAALDAATPPGGEVDEATRRLAAYVRATQPRLLPHVAPVARGSGGRRLVLDAKTLRHLEISRPMNPDDVGSPTLLSTWDETRTAAGRRTLAFWLSNPLADVAAIEARLAAVDRLRSLGTELESIRAQLGDIADLARIASRVAGRRTRPPELATLRTGLAAADRLAAAAVAWRESPLLADLAVELRGPPALGALLERAIPESPPPTVDGGGLFRPGFSAEIDRPRAEEEAAVAALAELERREQAATGIKGLKIGYNQVFGYYFEVTRPHLARVPPHFRRKQTVAQGERFVSDELDEVERRIVTARAAAEEAEAARWEALLAEIESFVPAVHRVARAVGALDVLVTFARLARDRGLVRPVLDDSAVLLARDLRHPVLDRQLGERFVPNDVELDAASGRLLILTGPNMSGKSTYMRQVGLLVVLAQAGSFVPARYARVGLVTQLFTRMGFTDAIGRGKSSFMVEMTEVAEILRAADARSLVLLDEVGRGTSTFDGLAIAWATVRHLHDATGCRGIVATHYHQLTDRAARLTNARNAHLAVRDAPDGIVFLHRLVPGATDRSYGVHVARLAGVPEPVLGEADRTLRELEAAARPVDADGPRGRGPRYTQTVLWDSAPTGEAPLKAALEAIDVEALTPDEAKHRLRALRRLAAGPPGSEP